MDKKTYENRRLMAAYCLKTEGFLDKLQSQQKQ
jgi:hypothetical protein